MKQFIEKYEDDPNYIVSYNEHGYYVIVNRKTLKWFSFNYIMLLSTKLKRQNYELQSRTS